MDQTSKPNGLLTDEERDAINALFQQDEQIADDAEALFGQLRAVLTNFEDDRLRAEAVKIIEDTLMVSLVRQRTRTIDQDEQDTGA